MIKKSRARHCEKNLTDIVFPTACKLSSQTLLLCLHLRIGEKDWRLPFWMLFQLKLIIMRACAVAVLLVTLTHIAVDAGFLTSLLTGSSMLRKPSLPKLPKLPRPLQKVCWRKNNTSTRTSTTKLMSCWISLRPPMMQLTQQDHQKDIMVLASRVPHVSKLVWASY
ncbi:uncharacterized protein LOC119450571 isoform X2 [Dermacentor silvarum]|uniref:uncharacterized protein LOC119450571 isoform X2 n=1 Tax=Dermacentor silvarum TaxID=543639 RepID=UPI002100EE7F|nr:uncharacterized protein LOC119450571 isoform X2 [Dermacentor silvarum]